MAKYVTKVRTESGDLQIDYNALANLPETDKTLTKADEFADAKVTGDRLNQLDEDLNQLNEDLKELDETVIKSINGLTPEDDGNLALKPEDIGAVSASDPYVGTIGGIYGEIGLGDGLGVDTENNSIVNTGVLSVATGVNNGTINVNTNGTEAEVPVAGLKRAAYTDGLQYSTTGTTSDLKYPTSGKLEYVVTAKFELDVEEQVLRITMAQ